VAIQNFEERVIKIISQAVPAAYRKVKITPDLDLTRHLGFSSLALAMMVSSFEEEFGVEIDPSDLSVAKLRTVKDLLQIGKELVEQAGGK
jgi:acyl carrier protein